MRPLEEPQLDEPKRHGVLSTAISVGRLHIVAIAALASLTFGWAFTGRYLWLVPAVCALDWFLVNLLNRVVDLEEDAANRIAGTSFVARWRKAILGVGFSLLGVSLIAVHSVAPMLTPFRLAYHTLGLTYNWPLLPGGRRLKQLYLLKNTASATGFLLTCFAYPIAIAGSAALTADLGWPGVITFGVFFFLFELSYEVLYDLRDVVGDRQANVRTFAVVHGEAGAKRVADALMAGSALILIGAWIAEVVPWRLACMAAAPVTQLVVTRFMLKRGISAADCIRLTWLGAALLALYHGWIALGLTGSQV